jgi:hypothetical protein
MPVRAFGQQRARNKRAERCGQAGRLHHERDSYHHQQRRGGQCFFDLGAGDQAEQMIENEAADCDHADNGAECLQRRSQTHWWTCTQFSDGEQRNQRDQWNGREVLEQQDTEGRAPVPLVQLAFLLEYLQCKRRG